MKFADEVADTSIASPASLGSVVLGKSIGFSNPMAAAAGLALSGVLASIKGISEGAGEGFENDIEGTKAEEYINSVKENVADTKEGVKIKIEENTTGKIKETAAEMDKAKDEAIADFKNAIKANTTDKILEKFGK
jgi:hypothetical protein